MRAMLLLPLLASPVQAQQESTPFRDSVRAASRLDLQARALARQQGIEGREERLGRNTLVSKCEDRLQQSRHPRRRFEMSEIGFHTANETRFIALMPEYLVESVELDWIAHDCAGAM